MFKKWLIEKGIKILIGGIALGIGIWYLSSSIGGASLSYTSMDLFMKQIGAENGDIASVNGCFLCFYIGELFATLGRATEMFWIAIVQHLWILMAIGFGIFIIFHTISYLNKFANSNVVKNLTQSEPKFVFSKWFEKVWKTGLRVMIAGALIGAIGWSGTGVLKTTTKIIVEPVMYLGTTLSMAATNAISNTKCDMVDITETKDDNPLTPVLQPFMCVMGNLNTVMLAGAGGGFALMNYSWLGLGGGLFTWLAGLTLVIMFLVIGFDLLFQVLSVIFKLIFVIIFMPFLIAAAAFEQVWSLAKEVFNSAINMLINSAISILKISLKIVIMFAVVYFASDAYYPGPTDGFTAIMPPLFGELTPENPDAQTMSVMNVFKTCEQVSIINNEIDKDKFVSCFKTQKSLVEARYDNAFNFMDDGFDFLMFMIGVFFLYFWVVSPKVDAMLGTDKENKEQFDYGQWIKDFGKTAYNAPGQIYTKIRDKMKEGK